MKNKIIVTGYFVLTAVLLLALSFQGLSDLDVGLYMSGYKYFNDDPITVYYAGQWLMSFELSGWLMRIFSIEGYFGLRVMRVVLVVAMEIVCYLYLKRYMPRRYILIGLLLVTLSQQECYSEINYNDYSSFLLCLSLLLFHRGIVSPRHGNRLFLMSGLVAGISFFFRLTNLTFLTIPLCLMFILPAFGYHRSLKRSVLPFYGGVATGVAVMLLTVFLTGKWAVLTMTVTDLFSIGSRGDDPHNLKQVFICLCEVYQKQIKGGSVLVFFTLLYAVLRYRFHAKGARIALLIAYAAAIWINIYLFHEFLSDVEIGFCWIVMLCCLMMPQFRNGPILLFAVSLLLPLLLPAGTNAVIGFMGQHITFLPVPLAFYILSKNTDALRLPALNSFKRIATITTCIFVATAFCIYAKRPLIEDGSYRLMCRYKIDSPVAKGIYTNRDRAGQLNHLIHSLKGTYLNGDYLFCTFDLPLVSLLECRPFGVFSTVFCSTYMSTHYMAVAENHLHTLPFVLIDKDNFPERDKDVVDYLKSRTKYIQVWTDGRYQLLKPEEYHK